MSTKTVRRNEIDWKTSSNKFATALEL